MAKTILYIHFEGQGRRIHQAMQEGCSFHYNGLFYEDLDHSQMPGIRIETIRKILEENGSSIDLVIVEGSLNNAAKLASIIRSSRHTEAVSLVAPLYRQSADASADLVISGADFGMDHLMLPIDVAAGLNDLFSGRTSPHYIFNTELYSDNNGILVPMHRH